MGTGRPKTAGAGFLYRLATLGLALYAGAALAEPRPLPYRSRGPFIPVLDLFGRPQQGLVLSAEEADSGRPAPISIGNTTFYPKVRRGGQMYGGYTSIKGDLQVLQGEIYLENLGIGSNLHSLQQQNAEQEIQINQQQDSLNTLGSQAAVMQQSLRQTNQVVESLGQTSAQQAASLETHSAAIDGLTTELLQNRHSISRLSQNITVLGNGVAGATALAAALGSLPNDAGDAPIACGIGSGGYSERYALAIGCSVSLNNSLSVNAGGAYVFGGASDYGLGSLSNVAGQLGLSYRFGKRPSTDKPISKQELEHEIQLLKQQNDSLLEWITRLEVRLNNLQASQ